MINPTHCLKLGEETDAVIAVLSAKLTKIERLEAAIKTHHDAIDAQPWASDEPVGVLLNKVTARLTQAEARVKALESELAAERQARTNAEFQLLALQNPIPPEIRAKMDANRARARVQKGGAS